MNTVTASPAQLNSLPAPIRHGFIQAFDASLHVVFLVGVPIGLLAFVLSWFLKELPLRDKAYVSALDPTEPVDVESGGPVAPVTSDVPDVADASEAPDGSAGPEASDGPDGRRAARES